MPGVNCISCVWGGGIEFLFMLPEAMVWQRLYAFTNRMKYLPAFSFLLFFSPGMCVFAILQAGERGVPGPGKLMALLLCLLQQALLYGGGL